MSRADAATNRLTGGDARRIGGELRQAAELAAQAAAFVVEVSHRSTNVTRDRELRLRRLAIR